MAEKGYWLARLTAGKVLAELEAFTREGRHEYLERRDLKHCRARSYYIWHRGERCDMKAIAWAASGLQPDEGWNKHSPKVAKRLKELGFEISHER